MGFTVEEDKMLTSIHGYTVYRYTCEVVEKKLLVMAASIRSLVLLTANTAGTNWRMIENGI